MPYTLRRGKCRSARTRKRNCFWVVGPRGKKFSKDPIREEKAKAQMRLLRALEHGWVRR
jgi:hypothetical protein